MLLLIAMAIDTGEIILAYNPSNDSRNPLALASTYDGFNWNTFIVLANGTDTTESCMRHGNTVVACSYAHSRPDPRADKFDNLHSVHILRAFKRRHRAGNHAHA